jgi:plastocyanin
MKRFALSLIFLAAVAALLGTASAARATHAVQSKPAAQSKPLTILVKADDQHGRKGPDGKWHDAFLPADFSVPVGRTTTITIVNYDGSAHSMVSASLGLMVKIPAAKGSKPGRVTFTIKPKIAGKYDWWCGSPCDPWAMTHDGYMRGYITATR